jgi:uncharacterized protein YdhG (YjbR/CyaY superfamily)
MVQSKATTVDDYLAEAPPERREALAKVREIVRRELPGCEERMMYGMPAYVLADGSGFAFASQKQYIALYVAPAVHARNAEALKGIDCGKCCIRFRKPGDIDFALVERLLRDTAESGEPLC